MKLHQNKGAPLQKPREHNRGHIIKEVNHSSILLKRLQIHREREIEREGGRGERERERERWPKAKSASSLGLRKKRVQRERERDVRPRQANRAAEEVRAS
jgi:hypothetical protein